MKEKSLLVRFRDRDSREGVTRSTLKMIADALELSETEAVHRALVEYAQRFVPRYARDEGPLDREQYGKIADAVHKKHGNATVTESLFDEPAAGTGPRASKRLSASRSR